MTEQRFGLWVDEVLEWQGTRRSGPFGVPASPAANAQRTLDLGARQVREFWREVEKRLAGVVRSSRMLHLRNTGGRGNHTVVRRSIDDRIQ